MCSILIPPVVCLNEGAWGKKGWQRGEVVVKGLCASASLSLSQAFSYKSTCVDDTSLKSLHCTLATSISGSDLTTHFLNNRQQFTVGGTLRYFYRLYKTHGRWTKITESWSEVGRGGEGGWWNTWAWWRVVWSRRGGCNRLIAHLQFTLMVINVARRGAFLCDTNAVRQVSLLWRCSSTR